MQQDDMKPIEVHEESATAGAVPETGSDEKFAAVERALLPQPTNDPNDPLVRQISRDIHILPFHFILTPPAYRTGQHEKSTRRT